MSSIPLLLLAACFQTNADKPAADAPPPSPTAQPPAETPQPASAATLPDLTEGLVSGQCEDGPGAEDETCTWLGLVGSGQEFNIEHTRDVAVGDLDCDVLSWRDGDLTLSPRPIRTPSVTSQQGSEYLSPAVR